MRHDLAVENDIGFGLKTRKANTSCNPDDVLARTSDGHLLQCNSSWFIRAQPAAIAAANGGGSVAALRLAAKAIGLDGPGAMKQDQMGTVCEQTGEFRRDEVGGVVGCQKGVTTSVAKWSRMGVEEIRWKMFSQPILVPFDTPEKQQSRELDLKNIIQMSSEGAGLRLENLRMVLINVNLNPGPASNDAKESDSRMGDLCTNTNSFFYGLKSLTDNDVVVDARQKCKVNLFDFFSAGQKDGRKPEVKFALLGYLCEGKNGCSP